MMRAVRLLALGMLLGGSAAITAAALPYFSGIDRFAGTRQSANISDRSTLPFHLDKLKGVFPIGLVVSGVEYYVGQRNSMAWHDAMRNWSFAAHAPTVDRGKETYVLIIGESSRRDRWQLAGYGRATNPLLSREPNVIPLPHLITPWTYTVASVPVIASRKPGTDHSRIFGEKSILTLFKEAGFTTYWVSNQAQPTGMGSSIGEISSEADVKRWLNIAANDVFGRSTPDEVVLGPLQEILRRPEKKQFIVLHLLGSHDAYNHRYPVSFNRFRPSLTDAPRASDHDAGNRNLIDNAYDNSVGYTDSIIQQAISSLRKTDAIAGVLYTSDHGESLFDGMCPFVGHGGTARENYTVSALAWLSDRYMITFRSVMPALTANARKRLSTENIFESMAGLAHINFPTADRSRSVFSPTFRERDRIVNVGERSVDWDKARFVGACQQPAEDR